jgi:hypothetical protein
MRHPEPGAILKVTEYGDTEVEAIAPVMTEPPQYPTAAGKFAALLAKAVKFPQVPDVAALPELIAHCNVVELGALVKIDRGPGPKVTSNVLE